MQKQDSGFDRTPPFPRGSSRTHATVLTKKQRMRCGKGLTSNLRRLCLHPKEQYPAALAWLGPSRDQPGCMGCTLYDMVVGSGTSPNYMTLQSKTRHANRASQHSKRLKIESWHRGGITKRSWTRKESWLSQHLPQMPLNVPHWCLGPDDLLEEYLQRAVLRKLQPNEHKHPKTQQKQPLRLKGPEMLRVWLARVYVAPSRYLFEFGSGGRCKRQRCM